MHGRGFSGALKGFASAFARAALVVSLSFAATPPATMAQTAPSPFQQFPWVREGTDVRPHPGVRIGRLPNGMTYILMPRKAARGTAAIYMVIAAGSMQERDDQRGLAHFVEHMAFNGSTNIPEGELSKILARHGFAFGSDANAATTYEYTEYQLTLPKTDAETLDTAFMILRETASNLSFTPEAIERERGVVLGEERLRSTAGTRAGEVVNQILYKGQRYPDRRPIGLPAIISSAPRSTILDYYKTWYRPELTTLIIVGDIDAGGIEARIGDRFADWKGQGPVPQPVDYGRFTPKGLTAFVSVGAGMPEAIGMQWSRPVIEGPDTLKLRQVGVLKTLAVLTLNDRLAQRARSGDAPFLSARLTYGNNPLTANFSSLVVVPKPGQQGEAMTEALKYYNQFKTHGVTASEIERFVTERETGIKNAIEAEKSRANKDIAASLNSARAGRSVFVSAEQIADQWMAMRGNLTVAAVNEQVAFITSGDGPFITRYGEAIGKWDEKALISTYQTAMTAKVEPYQAVAAKPWPYTDFGTPGMVVKTDVNKAFGFTQYSFANGLKVNIKPSKSLSNRIMVSVRMGGGMMLVSPEENISLIPVSLYNFSASGLGKLSQDEMRRSLSGRTYGATFSLGDDFASLMGTTTPEDFVLQMQVLMAYYTDPGYRPESFANIKTAAAYSYGTMKTNPKTMFDMGAVPYLRSNDPRVMYPTEAQMAALSNDQLKALIERIIRHVPIEITIVGDITPEAALAGVAQTFGTLSALPSGFTVAKGADVLKLPADRTPRVFTHKGRDDQGISFMAFPTTDLYQNMPDSRGLQVLALIFNTRLREDIREKQSASYTANVTHRSAAVFKGYGYLAAEATVKPEMDEAFNTSTLAIAASLRDTPVTQDELDRARLPLLEDLAVKVRTNGYWFGLLPGLMSDAPRQAYNQDVPAQLKAVTVADIQRLAKTYLVADKVLRMKVMKEAPVKP